MVIVLLNKKYSRQNWLTLILKLQGPQLTKDVVLEALEEDNKEDISKESNISEL